MAIVVGTDSYVTVDEVDVFVSKYYPLSDPLYIMWHTTELDDKEVYVRKAFRCIEQLPLKGAKYLSTQITQFPRHNSTTLAVPQEVKDAQAELSIAAAQLATGTGVDADMSERRNLQMQGVTSIKIGKLSEEYDLSKISFSNAMMQISESARNYLKPWLGGGYNIQGIPKTNRVIPGTWNVR